MADLPKTREMADGVDDVVRRLALRLVYHKRAVKGRRLRLTRHEWNAGTETRNQTFATWNQQLENPTRASFWGDLSSLLSITARSARRVVRKGPGRSEVPADAEAAGAR